VARLPGVHRGIPPIRQGDICFSAAWQFGEKLITRVVSFEKKMRGWRDFPAPFFSAN
jgi:hypothetical protein